MKSYEQFINSDIFEQKLFSAMFDLYLESNLVNDAARNEINGYINEGLLVKENFYDSLKNRYEKAKTVVKNFSDNAKQALETIVNAAKTSVDFINAVAGKIKAYSGKILTGTKDKFKKELQAQSGFSDKLKTIGSDKHALSKELKNLGDVVNFYKTSLVDKLVAVIKTSFTELLAGDKQPLVEKVEAMKAYLNESADMGNNVIQKLVHGVEQLPPFTWLHNLKHAAGQGIDKFIQALNVVNKNVGAPELVIPVISGLLALAIEYKVKNIIKHGIAEIALEYAIPFIGIVLEAISWTALVLAVYEIVHAATATVQHVQGGHAGSGHAVQAQAVKPAATAKTSTQV